MNQTLKKKFVKTFAVLFSSTAIFTVTNPQTSYAMMGHNHVNQNEPNQDKLNRRLLYAMLDGDVNACRDLIVQGADVNAIDSLGRTILICTIQNNRTEIVNTLLAYGADVNAVDSLGRTPLMIAATSGHIDIVNALINYIRNNYPEDLNAIPNYVNVSDNDGYTALISAAGNGHIDIVNTLLENGANINARDHQGCTPLMYAVQSGSPEIISLLLYHGAETNVTDIQNRTPADFTTNPNIINLLHNLDSIFCNQDKFQAYLRENYSSGSLSCSVCLEEKNIDQFMCVFDCYYDNNHKKPCYEHYICRSCLYRLRSTMRGCPFCGKPLAPHDAKR